MRWLTGGVALTLFSSFGQTFFIALFAGEIRTDFNLGHGDFGLLYMVSTLASAATLVFLGRIVDDHAVVRVASAVIVMLAMACVIMASASSVIALAVAIYLLRLFGQGMMSHVAMTAMGRWFVAERGRAVSVTTLGHQLGEGLLPIIIVTVIAMTSWRHVWVGAALLLILVALPLVRQTLSQARIPSRMTDSARSETGRQWTRGEVVADVPFWIVCTGVLAPSFIGTSVFFHQVHLADLKGWPSTLIASSFILMSVTTVSVALVSGLLIDRFSARQILPFFLAPLAVGCSVLSLAEASSTMFLFMMLLGCSYGISSSVFGAIWPEIYGTRHLGAVRSLVFAAMVFASALGPGLTGWLIDRGVGFETQLLAMAIYCWIALSIMVPVSRLLHRRLASDAVT